MLDTVLNTIKNNNMFNKGDKVLIAVSGGPDSICLLHVLYTLRKELDITLFVSHVNHCLRGDDSDKDEEYVREFCRLRNINCFVKREDVHKISVQKGISCEVAGREVRYSFFDQVLKRIKGDKIAIAHNANDQAETLIMRIIRGTGMEGLVGIKSVRDNVFVRPLIKVSRDEIENYCKVNNLNPRIDKTNLENIYTRNKIRLELIPYIKKNFNPDIVGSLNRLSDIISIDNDYLEMISLEKYRIYCKKNDDRVIINSRAFKEHESILTRIIRNALKNLNKNLYNFQKVHIYDIIVLQKGLSGKVIMLPGGVRVLNNYGDIHIYIETNKKSFSKIYSEYMLNLNQVNNLTDLGLNVSLKVSSKKQNVNLKEDRLIKFFDYDKINGDIKLRYRKNGDKFTPLGMTGSKKLKDLFIDLKIPKDARDKIPLIIFGKDIAWIVGYRISDKFKIDKETKNILEIKIKGEEQ